MSFFNAFCKSFRLKLFEVRPILVVTKQIKKTDEAVINAVKNILTLWQLSDDEQTNILGLNQHLLLSALDSPQQDLLLSEDQEERMRFILNIHSSLRALFENPKNIYNYK